LLDEECGACGEDGELGEDRAIKGQARAAKPSHAEWDNHMRTHIPYRQWCRLCLTGKRNDGAHVAKENEIKEHDEVRVRSFCDATQKPKEVG